MTDGTFLTIDYNSHGKRVILTKRQQMLKAGVIGAGHLGKIHLKLLQASEKYELVGFFENDSKTAETVEKEFGYRRFNSYEELLAQIEVIDIVTPTMNHFDCAKMAIENGKHVFIEKVEKNTNLSRGEHYNSKLKN